MIYYGDFPLWLAWVAHGLVDYSSQIVKNFEGLPVVYSFELTIEMKMMMVVAAEVVFGHRIVYGSA